MADTSFFSYWLHETAACCYFGVLLGKGLDHNSLSRFADGTPYSSSDLLYFTLLLPFYFENLFLVQLPFSLLPRQRELTLHRSNLTSSASVILGIHSKFRDTDYIRRNRPFNTILNFSCSSNFVPWYCKSDLQEESPRITHRSSDSIDGIR